MAEKDPSEKIAVEEKMDAEEISTSKESPEIAGEKSLGSEKGAESSDSMPPMTPDTSGFESVFSAASDVAATPIVEEGSSQSDTSVPAVETPMETEEMPDTPSEIPEGSKSSGFESTPTTPSAVNETTTRAEESSLVESATIPAAETAMETEISVSETSSEAAPDQGKSTDCKFHDETTLKTDTAEASTLEKPLEVKGSLTAETSMESEVPKEVCETPLKTEVKSPLGTSIMGTPSTEKSIEAEKTETETPMETEVPKVVQSEDSKTKSEENESATSKPLSETQSKPTESVQDEISVLESETVMQTEVPKIPLVEESVEAKSLDVESSSPPRKSHKSSTLERAFRKMISPTNKTEGSTDCSKGFLKRFRSSKSGSAKYQPAVEISSTDDEKSATDKPPKDTIPPVDKTSDIKSSPSVTSPGDKQPHKGLGSKIRRSLSNMAGFFTGGNKGSVTTSNSEAVGLISDSSTSQTTDSDVKVSSDPSVESKQPAIEKNSNEPARVPGKFKAYHHRGRDSLMSQTDNLTQMTDVTSDSEVFTPESEICSPSRESSGGEELAMDSEASDDKNTRNSAKCEASTDLSEVEQSAVAASISRQEPEGQESPEAENKEKS